MTLRYYSEFRDRLNARYRVEIHQENGGIEWPPREVVVASNPINIEWDDVDKIEPVQGSSATLNLISMSDREFADLYTIEPGTIRMNIYRNGTLYWSGMLDPEIFEEPYSYKEKYVTSLTFSDFGIINRKEWAGNGLYSLREVVGICIGAAGIQHRGLVRHISTMEREGGTPLTLDEPCVLGENFYDEEGEPMTLREVLDEVLKPFALRLVQKGGRVYIYDLNAIHTQQAQRVVWASTDANLEADIVYNNVKISFSPYADGVLVDGTLNHEQALKEIPVGISGELIRTDGDSASPEGFRIVYGAKDGESVGDITVARGARIFRIDPEFSGSKEAGVVYGYRLGDSWRLNAAKDVRWQQGENHDSYPIIKMKPKFIGSIPNPTKFQIKITMDVLFDVRYNPFESPSLGNEEGNWERLNNWCNYGYIPITLSLRDKNEKWLYSYYNRGIKDGGQYTNFSCEWQDRRKLTDPPGDYPGHAWLCYYDPNGEDGRKNSTGFGGWKTNRPIIGWYPHELPSIFKFRGNGEYLPLPPTNGYLHLLVYEGVSQFDNDEHQSKDIWSRSRWLMYKNPKVEIVKANGRDIDKEDIEDIAWLNKGAKESLEIDTIIGTMPDPVPSARGLLFRSDGTVYTQFHRAGHTDRLERLLIGTIYSQYAARKHILSGTVDLIPDFSVLTDTSEPGQYILLSEVQHLREAMSEIRMAQFEADSYEAIEYKNE